MEFHRSTVYGVLLHVIKCPEHNRGTSGALSPDQLWGSAGTHARFYETLEPRFAAFKGPTINRVQFDNDTSNGKQAFDIIE